MKFDAVIFDMDGTLIEAKEWHFLALNEALGIFGEEISQREHEESFDGLPTRAKLAALTEQGRIPSHLHGIISAVKQERTLRFVEASLFPSLRQLLMMQWLKSRRMKIAVATNSITATATAMLKRSGLHEFLDVVVTNEDVKFPKPHPEIYQVTCQKLGIVPSKAIVFEDNSFGIESAREAGCEVHRIELVNELDSALVARLVVG